MYLTDGAKFRLPWVCFSELVCPILSVGKNRRGMMCESFLNHMEKWWQLGSKALKTLAVPG